jgi:protein-L-isoaspartate(D-aspartate) O-methyltransferase
MIDAALQRKNMVESQVRPSDVVDRRVIRAMLEVPREEYVPTAQRAIAYMDRDVPLGHGRQGTPQRMLLAPRTFAKLAELAELEPTDSVLVVGAAGGYSAAVVARIARSVIALEQDGELADLASARLAPLAASGVSVVRGPLAAGAPDKGPFDAIIVEGAVSDVPEALLDQLKDGGRLVAILATSANVKASLWRRLGTGFDRSSGFDATAPLLPGFEPPRGFVF